MGALRLVQSNGTDGNVHAAREQSRTLCGYRITVSWTNGGKKFAKPPFPNVSCSRCRKKLGRAALTDEQRKQELLRAVCQLENLVALGIETRTLRLGNS